MSHEELSFTINGTQRTGLFPKGARLLDALRRLGYTGTKEGCGEGECGACTVVLGGRTANACIVYAKQAAGKEVLTVEGVGKGYERGLHPFQQAMVEAGGVQCGFCTPGFIVSGAQHLDRGGSTEDGALREAISGNLCRCTGYAKILQALKDASKKLGKDSR
jgi:aerobic-type carbon monoxide dehydrogenase small subunit (CoxS/CutS family)